MQFQRSQFSRRPSKRLKYENTTFRDIEIFQQVIFDSMVTQWRSIISNNAIKFEWCKEEGQIVDKPVHV